jgi:hypothetical protein
MATPATASTTNRETKSAESSAAVSDAAYVLVLRQIRYDGFLTRKLEKLWNCVVGESSYIDYVRDVAYRLVQHFSYVKYRGKNNIWCECQLPFPCNTSDPFHLNVAEEIVFRLGSHCWDIFLGTGAEVLGDAFFRLVKAGKIDPVKTWFNCKPRFRFNIKACYLPTQPSHWQIVCLERIQMEYEGKNLSEALFLLATQRQRSFFSGIVRWGLERSRVSLRYYIDMVERHFTTDGQICRVPLLKKKIGSSDIYDKLDRMHFQQKRYARRFPRFLERILNNISPRFPARAIALLVSRRILWS